MLEFLYFLTISVWFLFARFEHIKLYKLRKLQYVLTFVKRDTFSANAFNCQKVRYSLSQDSQLHFFSYQCI